jgi:hypothetical protein
MNSVFRTLAHRHATAAYEALGPQLVSIAPYSSTARRQAGPASDTDLSVVLQEAPSGMLNQRRLLQSAIESLTTELECLWQQQKPKR